jgi:hypothetical protein
LFLKLPSGAKQAAEKRLFSSKEPEKHTSGAKALVDLIGFMPGINPRPTARMNFRQLVKPCPFKTFAAVMAKAMTYQSYLFKTSAKLKFIQSSMQPSRWRPAFDLRVLSPRVAHAPPDPEC